MADRTVKVTLTAQVAGYISGMDQAAKKTRANADESGNLEKKLQLQGQAFSAVGGAALKMGAVAAAGIALAVVKFAQFDQAMSNVQAALQVSTKELGQLRAAAIDAGAKTVFSANEAADAIEELGKNGLTTAQILGGGLSGALSLATAGQLDVGRAAEVASVSMKQFGLDGAQIPHIADLLAAGAGKAAGDVEDLAQALAQGGLVAHQTGLTIEETTGALSAFADQGLKGSDAGTSLKSALQSLTPTSAKAKQEMKELGISAYDGSGQFVGLANFAGNLKDKLSDLTPEARNSALSIIFGSDAIRAASILYDEGADGIQKYIDQTNDSGYAAKVAADRMNNLSGDLEQLRGSLDTALIQTGSGANNTLRSLTQHLTSLVDVVGGLPEPVLHTGLALASVSAGLLLVGGGVMTAIPKLAAYRASLDALSISMPRAAAAAKGFTSFLTGPYGLAIAAAALGTKVLVDYIDSLRAPMEEYQNAIVSGASAEELFKVADEGRLYSLLDQATGSVKDFKGSLDLIANNKFLEGFSLPAQQLEQSLKDISTNLAKTASTDLPSAQKSFAALADTYHLNAKEQLELLDGPMKDYKTALIEQATAQGINVTSSDKAANQTNILALAMGRAAASNADLAGSYQPVADAVDGVITSLSDLAKELDAAQSKTLGARQAARDLEKAYDDFDAGLKKNGTTLDITTEKGRDNQEALDSIAAAARRTADEILDSTNSEHEYRQSLIDSRKELLDRIHDLGIHGQAAKDLRDHILALPSKKEVAVAVSIPTAPAQKTIDDFIRLNDGKVLSLRIDGKVQTSVPIGYGTGAGVLKKASGGAVFGAGTGKSDSVEARLSNGEHVLTAEEVNRAGGQGAVYAARARLMAGGPLQFASGGAVSTEKLKNVVQDARKEEAKLKRIYDGIKSSQKVAKAKAKADLAAATKDREAAEEDLANRRTADAALTKTYAGTVAEQGRDQAFMRSQARSQPNTEAGRKLAAKYQADLLDAQVSAAQQNVKALQDIIADPNASKAAKSKAKTKLATQARTLNSLQLKQMQDEVNDALADAAQAAADALADSIKQIADEFDKIDLSGLTKDVQAFQRVTNADGTVSIYGSTAKSAPTAEGISAFFGDQSAGNARFAGKLAQLAGKIPVGLLAYLTSLGVEDGEPYADALLSASATTLASLTKNYNASVSSANAIGSLVAPLIGHAGGGAVYGAGTGTSDSVIRRLSNGEHVLTAAEVSALGGQQAVYAMRASWKSGYASHPGSQGQYAPSSTVNYNTTFTTTQYYPQQMSTDQMTNAILAVAGGPSL